MRRLSNVHCYSCLKCVSKTRKELRPKDTSPPLAEMSVMLWIKHKLTKTSSPSKQTAFAEPNACVWSCAPELTGGKSLYCATGYRSWEIPQAGHGEFSTLCKGNCQTLGQEVWPEIPETRLGNNAVICQGHLWQGEGRQQGQGPGDAAWEAAMSHCKAEPRSGGWLGLRTGRWRVGDTKEGWWSQTSKRGQHLFLQVMAQTTTASVFGCVQPGWRKTTWGIPWRLGWEGLLPPVSLLKNWRHT